MCVPFDSAVRYLNRCGTYIACFETFQKNFTFFKISGYNCGCRSNYCLILSSCIVYSVNIPTFRREYIALFFNMSEMLHVCADLIGERNVSVIQEGMRAFYNSSCERTLQAISKYEIYSVFCTRSRA